MQNASLLNLFSLIEEQALTAGQASERSWSLAGGLKFPSSLCRLFVPRDVEQSAMLPETVSSTPRFCSDRQQWRFRSCRVKWFEGVPRWCLMMGEHKGWGCDFFSEWNLWCPLHKNRGFLTGVDNDELNQKSAVNESWPCMLEHQPPVLIFGFEAANIAIILIRIEKNQTQRKSKWYIGCHRSWSSQE